MQYIGHDRCSEGMDLLNLGFFRYLDRRNIGQCLGRQYKGVVFD